MSLSIQSIFGMAECHKNLPFVPETGVGPAFETYVCMELAEAPPTRHSGTTINQWIVI